MKNATNWRETHKQQAAKYVRDFYRTSYDWRNNGSDSKHQKWDRYERNYHSIYDPNMKAKKESWQSTMFIPYSVTNVEVIVSSLFKLLLGKRDPLRFDPRETGDEFQAELHSDILRYEIDMADFNIEFGKCLKELGIYGSSFMKFYWSKVEENRRIINPVRRGFYGTAKSLIRGEFASPSDVVGLKEENAIVLVEDRCRAESVHIRDIFLEPNSKHMERVVHRQKDITYGELVRLSNMKNQDGNPLIDKDSVAILRDKKESDSFELDTRTVQIELGNSDPTLPRTDYDKKHTLFEFWGPIPRKWVDLDLAEDTEEERKKAEEMVPGKILIASGDYYLSSEENPNPIPKPPFVQHDYIKCGQTYGKGICELIEGLQEEANEIRNLRVDNVVLSMNKIFVVVEKYLRDPDEVRSVPGGVIRLKGNEMNDARNAIMALDIPPTELGSYKETAELERQIQETTAANRVTTMGAPSGQNETLGGMELARQAAYDRFAVYAFMIGQSLREDALWIMSLSYQNSGPDRNRQILGEVPIEMFPDQWMPRWMAYKPLPPHEIVKRYNLKITDIFGMENRQQKAQQLASYGQLVASMLPGFDARPLLHKLGYYNEFSKDEVDEILKPIQGPIQSPMMMGKGIPSISKSQPSPTGEVSPASGIMG